MTSAGHSGEFRGRASFAGRASQATRFAAEQITRRRALRKLGQGVFAGWLLAVTGGTLSPKMAWAAGTCASPCGPSPICSHSECDSSVYCYQNAYVWTRPYRQTYCGGSNSSNYWDENYCSFSACYGADKIYRCRDCATIWSGGFLTTGCPGYQPKYTCICRKVINSSC